MKTLDKIKLSIFFMGFCGFFYLLTNSLISEHEKRQKYFKIEFNSGRIYWADSVNLVSENEISFNNVIYSVLSDIHLIVECEWDFYRKENYFIDLKYDFEKIL